MRKVAIVFLLAVVLPSLVLAGLAWRSLRDQQFVLERSQALLFQGACDNAATQIRDMMRAQKADFVHAVDVLLEDRDTRRIAPMFDALLRKAWPNAETGFAVTLDGNILSPAAFDSDNATRFRKEFGEFLSNRVATEVYPSQNSAYNLAQLEPSNSTTNSEGAAGDNLASAPNPANSPAYAEKPMAPPAPTATPAPSPSPATAPVPGGAQEAPDISPPVSAPQTPLATLPRAPLPPDQLQQQSHHQQPLVLPPTSTVEHEESRARAVRKPGANSPAGSTSAPGAPATEKIVDMDKAASTPRRAPSPTATTPQSRASGSKPGNNQATANTSPKTDKPVRRATPSGSGTASETAKPATKAVTRPQQMAEADKSVEDSTGGAFVAIKEAPQPPEPTAPRSEARKTSQESHHGKDTEISHLEQKKEALRPERDEMQMAEQQRVIPQYQPAQTARQNAPATQAPAPAPAPTGTSREREVQLTQLGNTYNTFSNKLRSLNQRKVQPLKDMGESPPPNSRIVPAEAEFRQLIGNESSGAVALFMQNRLCVLVWYKSPRDPQLIFGARIAMPAITAAVGNTLTIDRALSSQICLAVLDSSGRPVARTLPDFEAPNWKRPFVATEVGEALPHWEVAAYLLDPAELNRAASNLHATVASLIALMLVAIGVGGWLIALDLRRQLILARQKTDFVSNVSHELKTPLTSIRMFSELLQGSRADDAGKRRQFAQIIASEAARLTRLINNVLDFSRMERGEKIYQMEPCDLARLLRKLMAGYTPQLTAAGYTVRLHIGNAPANATTAEGAAPEAEAPVPIYGDPDAVTQIILNLVSNAEKYGGPARDIQVELATVGTEAVLRVLDRGPGVPAGAEKAIFEQFYRAHDALNSGIQGSGLGLTLSQQIAQAHHGDVTYQPRPGGGSIFTLRLPLASAAEGGEAPVAAHAQAPREEAAAAR